VKEERAVHVVDVAAHDDALADVLVGIGLDVAGGEADVWCCARTSAYILARLSNKTFPPVEKAIGPAKCSGVFSRISSARAPRRNGCPRQ
jgi:hypothetical protein